MAFNGRNSKTNFMQETKMGKSTSQGLDQFDNQAGKNIGLYMSENETPETKSKEEGNQKTPATGCTRKHSRPERYDIQIKVAWRILNRTAHRDQSGKVME
jgi:hypothetical protein